MQKTIAGGGNKMSERRIRCLECSHTFPHDVLKTTDSGEWGCPKCESTNIEELMPKKGYDYAKAHVKYGEGHHD